MKDLKKVTAFEDVNGKIWRSEEEYLADLSRRVAEQEKQAKTDLINQIIEHVYPRWNKSHMQMRGTYQSGQDLQFLLSRLSFEDLKKIEPFFVKMGVVRYNQNAISGLIPTL